MFNLIPTALLIVALGGIIYIASNHLSKLDEDDEVDDVSFGIKAKFVEWASRMPIEKAKDQSLVLARKTLHKTRLALLKTDNYLTKLIKKISEKEEKPNSNGDVNFWDNFSNEKKEKVIFASEEFFKPIVAESEKEVPKTVDSLSKKKTVRIPRSKKVAK